MPTLAMSMTTSDPPRVRLSTTRNGSSGYRAFDSTTTNIVSSTAPRDNDPIVTASPQLVVSACEKPKTSANNPPATRKIPGRSKGSWSVPLSVRNQRSDPAIATTAKKRFTKSVHLQEAYEVRIPPSNSPRAPPAPAMAPYTAKARPRSLTSVNVVVNRASTEGASSAPKAP